MESRQEESRKPIISIDESTALDSRFSTLAFRLSHLTSPFTPHSSPIPSLTTLASRLSTLVVGLGNPLLGDDGAGWRVVEQIQAAQPGVEAELLSAGGLALMERLVGYERAIVVDAADLGETPTGQVRVFRLEDLPNPFAGHLGSSHETNLQTALELGRALGAHLPDEVWVVAIQSKAVYDFSERLSPEVEAAIPEATQKIIELLGN
jgi:hydrogenase maturation protease